MMDTTDCGSCIKANGGISDISDPNEKNIQIQPAVLFLGFKNLWQE